MSQQVEMLDAYEIARRVAHYHRKNGYAMRVDELRLAEAEVALLVANGIIEVRPNFEGGPAIYVALTDKGFRMAQDRPVRRGRMRR